MIFVTVGTQLPFDRLVAAIDRLAPGLGEPVIAQCGPCRVETRHIERVEMLGPNSFAQMVGEASLIVAHAGIGTILAAQTARKPLVLMPRKATLGEHRSDHQIDTVRRLAQRPGLFVAQDEAALASAVSAARRCRPDMIRPPRAAQSLLDAVAGFLNGTELALENVRTGRLDPR